MEKLANINWKEKVEMHLKDSSVHASLIKLPVCTSPAVIEMKIIHGKKNHRKCKLFSQRKVMRTCGSSGRKQDTVKRDREGSVSSW